MKKERKVAAIVRVIYNEKFVTFAELIQTLPGRILRWRKETDNQLLARGLIFPNSLLDKARLSASTRPGEQNHLDLYVFEPCR